MSKFTDDVIREAKSDIVRVVESYGIELEARGGEFKGLCPFHNEKTPSFTVTPGEIQRFQCFGCGVNGDAIQFVQDYEQVGFREAVEKITGSAATDITPRAKKTIERKQLETWNQIVPVPETACQPMNINRLKVGDKWMSIEAAASWAYRNADGDLIGHIHRFDMPGGGKEVKPQTYCTNSDTGEVSWRWQSFDKPRPLYGLEKMAKYPSAQVIVVEGEKTADAAQSLFIRAGIPPIRVVVVSWPGGGKAVKHVDFSPLYARSVGLWPDADQQTYVEKFVDAGKVMRFHEQPGTIAMLDVFEKIKDFCTGVKFFMPPSSAPDGWDLADVIDPKNPWPSEFDLIAHIKTHTLLAADVAASAKAMTPAVMVMKGAPENVVVPPDTDDGDGAPPWEGVPTFSETGEVAVAETTKAVIAKAKVKEEPKGEIDFAAASQVFKTNPFFRVLGYEHERYYFLQKIKKQIAVFKRGDFTESGLIELAPSNWWEMNAPDKKPESISKKFAMNALVRLAEEAGVYDNTRLRGRGAWLDDGRMVFHHGHLLTVDGEPVGIEEMKTEFVYEMEKRLRMPADDELSDEDGAELLRIAEMFRWEKPGSAALLSGWVMLACICGALRWRSHIWLTGGAGSGKTYILNKFVHHLTNGNSLFAQGNSSEAGIRQSLGADAIPVLFDESEQNDEREKNRIQAVIALIRQSSSESEAKTLKGTVGGDAMEFHIQSMFCLASIQVGLKHQADIERISVLALKPKRDDSTVPDRWEEMKVAMDKMRKDKLLPGRLMRRSLNMLHIIEANIDVFAQVAAKHFGSQRDGDQYGTLLAGAWCLQSKSVATVDQAQAMLDKYDWSDHIDLTDNDDSKRALSVLMESHIRANSGIDLTVYELAATAFGYAPDNLSLDPKAADAILSRYGIRVIDDRLLLSNQSHELKKLMAGTSFEADLKRVLLRLEGADNYENKPVRFNGVQSKCISLPMNSIISTEAPSYRSNFGGRETF